MSWVVPILSLSFLWGVLFKRMGGPALTRVAGRLLEAGTVEADELARLVAGA